MLKGVGSTLLATSCRYGRLVRMLPVMPRFCGSRALSLGRASRDSASTGSRHGDPHETHGEIRAMIKGLCASYPGEYWRHLDAK